MKKHSGWMIFLFVLVASTVVCNCGAARTREVTQEPEWEEVTTLVEDTSDLPRVPPDEAYQRVKSGKALLVCAYQDEDKCRTMHLEGALFLREFEAKLPSLAKDQEIIFYCA